MDTGRILEITFVCVVLYLVLTNANQFSTALSAISDTYVSGVKVLQAR